MLKEFNRLKTKIYDKYGWTEGWEIIRNVYNTIDFEGTSSKELEKLIVEKFKEILEEK